MNNDDSGPNDFDDDRIKQLEAMLAQLQEAQVAWAKREVEWGRAWAELHGVRDLIGKATMSAVAKAGLLDAIDQIIARLEGEG